MANKDGTKSGGRSKGVKNRNKIDAVAMAQELGVDPLKVLLLFVKRDWKALGFDGEFTEVPTKTGSVTVERINESLMLAAAKEAIKYIYPAKKAMEISGSVDQVHKIGSHEKYLLDLYNQAESNEPKQIEGEVINASEEKESRPKREHAPKAKKAGD